MRRQKSQKILPWVTKDVVLNVLVYVLNLIFILFLFVGVVYINSLTNQMKYEEWLNETANVVHFFILLVMIIALMAGYFFFEDRDFLKNPVNSEMIFLIVEICLIICHISGNYVNLYVRPLALASVLTLFLTDKKKAVFINMIYCLLTFLFDSLGRVEISIGEYPVMLMGFASGIIAVFILENVYSRIDLHQTATRTWSAAHPRQGLVGYGVPARRRAYGNRLHEDYPVEYAWRYCESCARWPP